jgi:hypothetical protein
MLGAENVTGVTGRMVREEQTHSAAAARAELARILASANFDATERNRRFLIHLVEEALTGRAERIKACSIATAVLGGDERFADAPQVLHGHVAVTAGEFGRADEAVAAVAGILDLAPDCGARIADGLEGRGAFPELVRALVGSLAKAGLPAVRPQSHPSHVCH